MEDERQRCQTDGFSDINILFNHYCYIKIFSNNLQIFIDISHNILTELSFVLFLIPIKIKRYIITRIIVISTFLSETI